MAYIMHAFIVSAIAVVAYPIGVAAVRFDIGVNYGMLGDNLPNAYEVVEIFKHYGINKIRLFAPNATALDALRRQGIYVTLGIRNEDLPALAASQDEMNIWFYNNVKPYLTDIYFQTISVGNEIIPGEYAPYVVPVMQNLQNILDAAQLDGIKVSTVLSAGTLVTSFPPSAGEFTVEASNTLKDVLKFLSEHDSPLLVNVYPYFAYAADPVNISLPYAQFTADLTVVLDGNLRYYSLFDAVVDSFFSAMEKLGYPQVNIVVSETGWPNGGNGDLTTQLLAYTYHYNFVRRIQAIGTPKRPDAYISGFIFALFNENQKPAGVEQHFGLMYPSMVPVFPLNEIFAVGD